LGLITIPLIALALINRRARTRWFWFGAAAVIVLCMFGFSPLMHVIGILPGFRFSPLTRLQMLLPVPAAYLAAAGVRTRRFLLPAAVAILSAADLGVFAGRFYPYLDARDAVPPTTPTISFLQAQQKPFRIAPFFIYLWPNSSELYRLEDVRSHFSSEEKYRQLLHRIDPTSFGYTSTVIRLNSLNFNIADPLETILGISYVIEYRDIDIG